MWVVKGSCDDNLQLLVEEQDSAGCSVRSFAATVPVRSPLTGNRNRRLPLPERANFIAPQRFVLSRNPC